METEWNDRFVVTLDGESRRMVEECKPKCRAKTKAAVVRLAVALLHKSMEGDLYSKGVDGVMQRIVIV